MEAVGKNSQYDCNQSAVIGKLNNNRPRMQRDYQPLWMPPDSGAEKFISASLCERFTSYNKTSGEKAKHWWPFPNMLH